MRAETLAEQLMFTTVFVQGQCGSSHWIGTGFMYAVGTDAGTAHFLVSNKHVLEEAEILTVRMVKASADGLPMSGATETNILNFTNDKFMGHPDPKVDVAVIPIAPLIEDMHAKGNPPFFKSVSPEWCMTQESSAEFDAFEDITFIGYPDGIFDTHNFLPIMRSGTTAAPIEIDYQDAPAFLIDASVYPGSSGSPVFILSRGAVVERGGTVNLGTSRVRCLGILAAVHVRQVEGSIAELPARLITTFDEPIGLGIVYKAWTFDECVDLVLEAEGLRRQAQESADMSEELSDADEELRHD